MASQEIEELRREIRKLKERVNELERNRAIKVAPRELTPPPTVAPKVAPYDPWQAVPRWGQHDTSQCPCRPENGGSGICGCIFGGPQITCASSSVGYL